MQVVHTLPLLRVLLLHHGRGLFDFLRGLRGRVAREVLEPLGVFFELFLVHGDVEIDMVAVLIVRRRHDIPTPEVTGDGQDDPTENRQGEESTDHRNSLFGFVFVVARLRIGPDLSGKPEITQEQFSRVGAAGGETC